MLLLDDCDIRLIFAENTLGTEGHRSVNSL